MGKNERKELDETRRDHGLFARYYTLAETRTGLLSNTRQKGTARATLLSYLRPGYLPYWQPG